MADIFNKDAIKSWFKKNKYPTEAQFASAWDSFWHKLEKIPINTIAGLADLLNSKVDGEVFGNHAANTSNPHKVTAAQVKLDKVDNTSDLDKPISSLAQKALDLKADQTALQEALDSVYGVINRETLQQVCERGNTTTVSPIIPSATEDSHAATFAQVKQSLQEALQALANRVGSATEDVTVEFLNAEIEKLNLLVSSDDLSLDTIQEIVAFIKNNKDVIDAISTNKADRVHDHANASQVTSGFMSHNDKAKLDGIAIGANKYTHPSSHPATMITEDTNHRYATDAEKTKWNAAMQSDDLAAWAKQPNKPSYTAAEVGAASSSHSHNNASQTVSGFMASTDKTKLDGIAAGANKYTHPSSHPATMITEDANHRYATDAEKTKWNAAMQPSDLASWAKQPNKPSYTAAEVGAASSSHSHNNASQTVSGFMASIDKAKLDDIAIGANKYTHPSSHPATMITEDASHRYATDAEKTKWNAAMQPDDLAAWAKQPSKPSYTAAEVGAASSSHSHNGLNRVKRTNLITFTNARPDASMYPYSPGSTTSYLYTANSGVSFGIILPNATNHITPFDAKSFPAGAVVEVSVTNYEGCYVWTYLQIK